MVVGLGHRSETDGHELTAFQYSLAGVTSGICTRAINQPLDVLKIRFQLQEEPLQGRVHGKYHGFFQSIRLIFTEEGLKAFWKGHIPAQGSSMIYSLLQFSTFEFLNRHFISNGMLQNHNADFICGAIAGSVASFGAMPFSVLRTCMIAQGETKIYRNVAHATVEIWHNDRLPGFFRGSVPSVLQTAPYTGLVFLLYNFFNRHWNKYIDYDNVGTMACGTVAGTIAKVTTYPLDVIGHRLQINARERQGFGKTSERKGMTHMMVNTVRNEGFLGLFKGLTPSLAKAGLNSGFIFLFYELFCDVFQKF